MAGDLIEGQILTQTIVTQNLLSGDSIASVVADYSLREVEFMHIKGNGSILLMSSLNIFFATIGFGISIFPKFLNELQGKADLISKGEWVTLGC